MYGYYPIGSAPYGAAPPFVAPAAAGFERMVVLSPLYSDAATLSASSEITSLPVANLQSLQPKKVFRAGGSYVAVTVAFAEPVAANMLALVRHNLGPGGVIRCSAAGVFDTGWQLAWPVTGKPSDRRWPSWLSALRWSNDVEVSQCLVEFADPAGAYIEAGRLMVGRAWQPSDNFDLSGTPLGFDQADVQTRTDYGGLFTDRRTLSAPRRFSLQISALDRREVLDGIGEIMRLQGGWGDVVVLLDPAATTDFHRHSLQGVFTAPQQHDLTQLFTNSGECWSVSFPLREVI